MVCQYDRDCPSTLVCYANVTWTKQIQGYIDSNGCGCSTFYGFARDPLSNGACSVKTITAYYWLGYSSFLLILAIPIFMVASYDSLRLIALRQFNGALATTSLFVSLTMLFEILHMSGNLLNISFPLNEPVKYSIEGDTTTDKTAYYAEYENVSAGLAFMVATLALLNIPLFWIEVVQRMQKINTQQITNVSRFKWPLIIFQVLYSLTYVVVALILDLTAVMSLVGVVILLGIICAYLISFVKAQQLKNSIGLSSQAHDPKSKLGKFIIDFRRSSITTIFGMTISIIGVLSYAYINNSVGWKEHCKPNTIPFEIVGLSFNTLGLCVSSFGILLFTHSRVTKLGSTSTSEGQSISSNHAKAEKHKSSSLLIKQQSDLGQTSSMAFVQIADSPTN